MEKISTCINKYEKSIIVPESLRKDEETDDNQKKAPKTLKKEQEQETFTPMKVTENPDDRIIDNKLTNTDYRKKLLKVKTKESGTFKSPNEEEKSDIG